MNIIITAILIGLFLIIVIWLIIPKGGANSSNGLTGTPNQNTNGISLNIQSKPINPSNQTTTQHNETNYNKTSPHGNSVNTAFRNFVLTLFGIADGQSVDVAKSIDEMIGVLCENNTNEVRKTLVEYVDELSNLMENYQEGSTASEWSNYTGKSETKTPTCSSAESVSNAEQIEKIRFLSNKLNSQFENCVSYNGAGLGIFFGILASNVVSYKNKMEKGDSSASKNIRDRVMNYIQFVN